MKSASWVGPRTLRVETKPAPFLDFFKHVNLHFESSHLKYHHRPPIITGEKRRDLKEEGLFDFLYTIWGGVVNFAESVANVVKGLFDAIKSIADGNYYFDKNLTMNVASWNFDDTSSSAKEVKTITDGV